MRLTRRVFTDLAIWMVGFGLFIGVVFPFAMIVMGVPREIALSASFISMCVMAGMLVGGVNIGLVRLVVRPRLQALVDGMGEVQQGIQQATYTGDWSHCDPESCSLPVDSDDVIGQAAGAFNGLIDALSRSHVVEEQVGDFTRTMTSELELKPLCAGAMAAFMRASNATAAAILADTGGKLEVLAGLGIDDPERLADSEHVRLCLRSAEATWVELPEGLEVTGGLVSFRPREVAYLPVGVQGAPIGVVVLASSTPWTPDVRSLTRILARTFSMALANAMTHDHLQRIAALDPLTNCYNRRFGLGRLREELSRVQRNSGTLAGILFDIDHFKSINDTYGHLVGDRVLADVARVTRERLREGDLMVRYGGEEFLAVLPGASQADAAQIAERMRRAVEELVVRDAEQEIRCTISLGHAATPELPAADETALIKLSDDALYKAKASGRNKVVPARI